MISLLGQVVGDYRLEMTIGTGALGETFRAEDMRRGGLAAVKVMHATLASEAGFGERFREEAGRAAAVRHRNVLEIRDFGTDRGRWFIGMVFLEGGSLRTLLHRRTTQLPLRRAVELGIQAAAGLGALHAHDLLHRDLKPENLLVESPAAGSGSAGRLCLADAGLTRLAESGLTIAGTLSVGSLPYMAPEYVRGLALDVRSDLYSLGVVLYEAFTGHPPFQVATLGEALAKHTTAEPPAPRSIARDLPEGLERIVLRCLAKDPAARLQSAAELEAALTAELAGIAAPPVISMRPTAPPDGPLVVLRSPLASAPANVIEPAAPPVSAPVGAPAPRRFRLEMGAPPLSPPVPPPPAPAPAGRSPAPAEPPVVRYAPANQEPMPTLPDFPRERGRAPAPAAADSRRVRVALDRDALTLTPGQQAILTATIVNAGRTVDHFRLEVEGVPAGWVRAPAQPQQLNPGQRATVPLGVVVPRAPESAAGMYPVTVRARSRDNPADSGAAAVTWTVLPYVQAALTLTPPRTRAWRRGRFVAALRNEGNVPATFRIGVSDEEHALRWSLPGQDVQLEAGGRVELPLESRARFRVLGSAETRSFTVRADLLSAPAEAPVAPAPIVAGQLLHRALLPLWVPPLLIAAALALAFLLRGAHDVQLAVTPPAVQVSVNGTAALAAAMTDRRNEAVTGRPLAWRSRDTTIATVSDSGVVRGRKEGSTIVTVASGRVSAAVQVAVVAAQVEALTLAPKQLRLDIGASATLRAVPRDGHGTVLRRDVVWESSDPTVATVGGNGRVSAKAGGSATITARAEQKSATVDVTVNAPAAGGGGGAADCVAYEPGALKVQHTGSAGWAVSDGKAPLLTLDTKDDAQRALALAQRWQSHCFLGRTNARPNRSEYVIEYWDAPTGAPTTIKNEKCESYDRAGLKIVDRKERGFELADGGRRLLLADGKRDAQKAWEIAQHRASICYIGRDNRRPNQRDYVVQYWH